MTSDNWVLDDQKIAAWHTYIIVLDRIFYYNFVNLEFAINFGLTHQAENSLQLVFDPKRLNCHLSHCIFFASFFSQCGLKNTIICLDVPWDHSWFEKKIAISCHSESKNNQLTVSEIFMLCTVLIFLDLSSSALNVSEASIGICLQGYFIMYNNKLPLFILITSRGPIKNVRFSLDFAVEFGYVNDSCSWLYSQSLSGQWR